MSAAAAVAALPSATPAPTLAAPPVAVPSAAAPVKGDVINGLAPGDVGYLKALREAKSEVNKSGGVGGEVGTC